MRRSRTCSRPAPTSCRSTSPICRRASCHRVRPENHADYGLSDAHEGIKAAIAKVLHATWQRCRVHLMRNLLAHAGRQGRGVVAAFIATAFAQEDAEAARAQWRQVADQLRPKVAKLAALMDEVEPDVLAYMGFPAAHRPKLHSTNPIERLNGEIKRRTEVVGIFPNEAAIIRLVGAIPARVERRMGRPTSPLHDPGNHRSFERRSHRQAARRGSLTSPASPAGDDESPAAPTPRQGARPVLGSEKIDWLVREAGISRGELLTGLSRELPRAVDKLTPHGRIPTAEEASRIIS